MNSIFQELLYEEVLANYMDDFIILDKAKKELEENTNSIFEDSREA